MENQLDYEDITFIAKPDAVPYNYRISYKVTQICLIMHICGRGGSCSLIKLQMISYALFSNENMKKLVNFAAGTGFAPLVRFDPSVNRALTFATAYGFIEQIKNGNFKLTEQGKNLADKILEVGNVMTTEVADMNNLARKLTEKMINELVDMWGIGHV